MTGIIKVDTIQNNGGTTGLTIDSNGVVTRPVVPAWRATAILDVRTAAGGKYVTWSTTTDHEFTVPVTGLYQLNVNVRVDGVGGGYAYALLQVNDSNVSDAYSIEGTPSPSYQTLTIADVYYIEANDKVSVFVGTSTDTSYEVDGNSTFSGVLVG